MIPNASPTAAAPRGFRMTRQRHVILEELRTAHSHPTADEVHRRVRRRLPRVSLATVYRNLEVLADRGLIGRVDLAGPARRYDGDLTGHYHVRCARCGRIGDVQPTAATARAALGGKTDFRILAHRLEFVGLCPPCQAKAPAWTGGGQRN